MQNDNETFSVIRQRVEDFRSRILAARSDFERRHATKPESETSGLIQDLFRDLGYKYLDGMATEYKVPGLMGKDDACDIALSADSGPVKKPAVFVEVKAYSKEITKNHRDQVCKYASKSKVTWAIVTNGIRWEVYRVDVSRSKGVDPHLAFCVDLSNGVSGDALFVFSALYRNYLRGDSFQSLADRNAKFTPECLAELVLRPESVQCLVRLMSEVHHVDVSESALRSMLAERVIGNCVAVVASSPVTPSVAPSPSPNPSAQPCADGSEFTFTAKGITARCRRTADGFMVFAGQAIAPAITPSAVGTSIEKTRNQLMLDGVIANGRFARDHIFSTASGAASCILGSSVNGNAVWKPA